MPVEVDFTTDPNVATERLLPYLHTDPVRHNVLCTLLGDRVSTGTPVRCWWAQDRTEPDEVLGVAFQSPANFPVLVSRLALPAVEPLAAAVASADAAPVPGVNGVDDDASRFVGALATVSRRPARPVEGQRIYEVEELIPTEQTTGVPRPATGADLDLAVVWSAAFAADTDSLSEPQPEERLRRLIDARRLWIWEVDGEPTSTAVVSTSTGGVTRVGFVYTPPEHRRRGHAAAIVTHVSHLALQRGDRCILYTQLSNPTSNAIYQRLGYRPTHECVRYELS
ncbi:MAG: GNAT family N-acetyltransferase [Acidimicrobiales bacterium]